MGAQPPFFEESEKRLCSVVQTLLKANGPSLCSNEKDPASLSKNIWILPVRCGTALHARCLLSVQLDTCEMLGDHRLISMYTTAFLREERLLIGLFIMDVQACELFITCLCQLTRKVCHSCTDGYVTRAV